MPRLVPILLCAALLVLLPTTTSATLQGTQGSFCQPGSPATPTASASPAAAGDATPAPSTSAPSGPARTVQVSEADALLWGAGDHGVLLVHGAAYDAASWEPQAIAAEGVVVLALEEISSDDVLAGLAYLTTECGVTGVTLIGASAGASAALSASASATQPDCITQMILLSGAGDVASLGDYPKVFVASEGEGLAATVETMATDAPGDANTALILPGDAHAQAIFTTDQGEPLLQEILTRLKQLS